MKRYIALLLTLLMLLTLPVSTFAAESNAHGAPDYSEPASWAYFELGEDKDVDVFLICPTVDTRSETNSFDLNDKLKAQFLYALDLEKGIYDETGRLFSPYYRQMSMNAYKLGEAEHAQAREIARQDVSAAFRWYLDHENAGRPLILAGFSQGAEMCLELLKEFYGGESAEARALRDNLIAVYAIGWAVTEEMTLTWPQIVPAKAETDVGTVVSFDCEDGTLAGSLVIPQGTKALSINPLNWKTDGTAAGKSLNAGAVMSVGAEPIPALCGAYLGARGELVVTDVSAAEYPNPIDIFPEGSYHVYDYLFFFTNLKQNVADRTAAFYSGTPFKDVRAGAWYAEAVKYVYDQGLIMGMSDTLFGTDGPLTCAQLLTILDRRSGGQADACGLDPNAPLTREETALVLWTWAKSNGIDVSVGEDTNILSYNDAFNISEAAVPAMQWAVGAGIIQGTGSGNLEPGKGLTRAQAAAMLQRFDKAAQPAAEKTGIIGAMEVEVASLKSAMEITSTKIIAGMEFCEGTLDGKAVVVVQCGMGKVNAGICAHTLINDFEVTRVINTGVAGSLDNAIDIGDIVVSTDAVQHDYDVSPIGFARGEIPYTGLYAFPADEALRAIAVRAAKEVAPEIKVFEGRVCSGDQFIASREQKETIIENFGGKCCEMEGGAIAQACYLNGTPFVIIRAISDKADASEEVSFQEFEASAAMRCAAIVRYMIANS